MANATQDVLMFTVDLTKRLTNLASKTRHKPLIPGDPLLCCD